MTALLSPRDEIAKKVRELRTGRGLSQTELAKILGLSQNRLSELERGKGSFSAEQFLALLRVFNVTVNHFTSKKGQTGEALQKALARLGAFHLVESPEILPSERLDEVEDVVRETLLAGDSPRNLAALAPVLVANLDHLNLARLRARLQDYGLAARLGWLLENTVEALHGTRPESRKTASKVRKAQTQLEAALERVQEDGHSIPSKGRDDVLGTPIHSRKTLESVRASSSPISRRWGIISSIQPKDFQEALNGARLAH